MGREAVGACVAAGEDGAVLELVETTLPRLHGGEHEGLRAWLIGRVSRLEVSSSEAFNGYVLL
jgi:hypothetical protein